MPTVVVTGAFAIRIYTHDHAPAHVHVVHGDANLKVYLEGEREPELRGTMAARDVKKAIALVAMHYDMLLTMWREIHP